MYDQKDGNGYGGYGKRPMWQWILLYVIVGGALYYGVYYFMFGRNGGYGYNAAPTNPVVDQSTTNTNSPTGTDQSAPENNPPVITTPTEPTNPAATPVTTAPKSTPAQGTVVLKTANGSVGTYLVATNGMTLYQSAKDSSGVSNCTGGCAGAWPPYSTSVSGSLLGGAGVSGSISTITRADGTKQITYNGMPLYFWQGDKTAGDTTGENVNGFSVVKI